MKREPSSNTLMKMFGSDEPIGTYAEERLGKAETLEESIDAIITYAEEKHREQEEYSDISPLGGLDIMVESVDEIAFSKKDILIQNFPEVDIQLELAKKLKQKGHQLKLFEDQIKAYNAKDELQKQWDDYCRQKKELEDKLYVYKNMMGMQLDKQIEPLDSQIAQLFDMKNKLQTDRPILRFARRGKSKSLTNKIGQLEEEKIKRLEESEQRFLQATVKTRKLLEQHLEYGFPAVEYPWEKDDELAEIHPIYSQELFDEAMQRLSSYMKEPKVYEEYQNAKTVLEHLENDKQEAKTAEPRNLDRQEGPQNIKPAGPKLKGRSH